MMRNEIVGVIYRTTPQNMLVALRYEYSEISLLVAFEAFTSLCLRG